MAGNKKSVNALKEFKIEQEQKKHNDIVKALVRIKNGSTRHIKLKAFGKVSVNALAEEAGVSRASLYGNHKPLLDKLHKINEKRSMGVNAKRKLNESKKNAERETIKELVRTRDLLAQENYRIHSENRKLKRQLDSLVHQLESVSNITPIKEKNKR